MASRFQACPLVASPLYPAAVAWSDENLIAVASGHLVTILNPALPYGPRGLITIPDSKPFPIGVIERKDLLSGCLLSTCLSRDRRPCVRSISWSHPGLAPNAGCLLAVCTVDGRVKLYRQPFCEFRAEWVEVIDISDMLYDYLAKISFGEVDSISSEFSDVSSLPSLSLSLSLSLSHNEGPGTLGGQLSYAVNSEDANAVSSPFTERSITAFTEVAVFPCLTFKEGSPIEVLNLDGSQRVWVSGILERLDGAKALVQLPETDKNGKQNEWVEINTEYDKINESTDRENHFPKVRPSMNVGNLPKEILLANCHGVGEILSSGQAVEAWTNDRWVEGLLMSFDEGGLLVKLHGDIGCVTLDAISVRLAPLWMSEQKLWQVTIVKIETEGQELPKVVEAKSTKVKENNPHQIVSVPKSKAKPLKVIPESCTLPLISANQYASRSAMLSSLVAAWSPMLSSSGNEPIAPSNSSNCCSLLAVGGKCGRISFWRIHEPLCYSVDHSRVPIAAMLVGFLKAHNKWITAISWSLLLVDASNPQVLLVTGSSDGSVKVWLGYSKELMKSSEANHAPFSLLKEVITVDSVPVSVLSVIVPERSLHKMHLAVGKGSGSFEVWICDISTRKFDKVGSYDAHDHVVTGLAWAFDGCCLYSCSQDNSVRSWILCGSSLCEVPLPSNTPGVNSSADLPNVFDSCFGVSVSSGNLVLAVARSFDVGLLNQMYQARTQKAAVEFFWIGGQELDISSSRIPEFNIEAFPGFSEKELFNWESNILWSLKQYEHPDKPLVVWDITAALLAFKQSAPKYVEGILIKWLSISYVGSHLSPSTEEMLLHTSRIFQKITSRQLHLLNIICRRVVLSVLKADKINTKQQNLGGLYDAEEEQMTSWMELLLSSERELRERLVGFSFSAILSLVFQSATDFSRLGCWHPFGLAQMERWVALDHDHVQDQLKLLASEVGNLDSRLLSICDYVGAEQCSYCSASVPFESPEVAFCQGVKYSDRVGQSHRLARCAVSMQVCPTTPLWFCVCCQRWASKLAPQTLFKMPRYPLDFKSTRFSTPEVFSKPLCPFCGILQQRSQPDFLLSPSPV
ncbi:hypothetical protein L1049_021085 [Liquidambar formosana]|uniref:Transcription factor IIIC 90kDa subunit N-terminal domain-containing protein n=1 Tax=Liquidambar formosana TaxID=63359 RepID=A0AAP0S988_LIQFO